MELLRSAVVLGIIILVCGMGIGVLVPRWLAERTLKGAADVVPSRARVGVLFLTVLLLLIVGGAGWLVYLLQTKTQADAEYQMGV
jgi:hypothetical protein